jgi:hypothetical protein
MSSLRTVADGVAELPQPSAERAAREQRQQRQINGGLKDTMDGGKSEPNCLIEK